MHFVFCIIIKVNYTYLNKITLILLVSECTLKTQGLVTYLRF